MGWVRVASVDPVTGSFSLTFDNAVGDLTDVTSGISITNLNFSLDSAPAFNYYAAFDMLYIGGAVKWRKRCRSRVK